MEKILSEKESLDLINVMISSARNNLQKGTGRIFLLWGYVIAVLTIANLLLFIFLPPRINYYSFYVWFATPLGLFVYFNELRKIKEMQMVRTYVDKIMSYVWIAFSIAVFTLVISMLLASIQGFGRPEDHFGPLDWVHWSFMIPFMLVLYGFALLVSGLAYRFKPLITGAVICWLCTLVTFSFIHLDRSTEIQLVSLILSIIAGYIIPGHLLNSKEKEHVQES